MASFYLKKKFKYITISPSEGYSGAVVLHSTKFFKYWDGWSECKKECYGERHIMLSLAGVIARKRFKPSSSWSTGQIDYKDARPAIDPLVPAVSPLFPPFVIGFVNPIKGPIDDPLVSLPMCRFTNKSLASSK